MSCADTVWCKYPSLDTVWCNTDIKETSFVYQDKRGFYL